MKKIVLALMAVFVVAPTSVAVLLATIFFPAALALRIPVLIVVLTLIGAWLGLAALVRLSSHYFRYDHLPPAPKRAAAGLLCCTASALTLMASAVRPLQFPTVLLCGPVVAAAILGYLLWMSWPTTLEDTDPSPLRRLLRSNAERLQLVALLAVVLIGLVALVLA